MTLFPKDLQKKTEFELYRLEQRYARRKHRSTYYGDAQYVDGEYLYSESLKSPGMPKWSNNAAHGGRHTGVGRSATSNGR